MIALTVLTLYQSWKKEIQNIVSKTHFYQKQLNIVCCCTKDVTKMVKSTSFNKVSKSTHSNYVKFQIRNSRLEVADKNKQTFEEKVFESWNF